MRDSLMPSRGSGGKKTALILMISGSVVMLIVAILIYRQRAQAASETPVPEPADTGESPKITRLVTPQPTRPIASAEDVGAGKDEPADPPEKKKPRKRKAKPEPPGKIDTSKYNAFINSRFGQVRACYERRLKINALLEGKLNVNISVNDRGWVNWVTVKRDTVRDREMLECVKKTIRSWQFPEPEGGNVVVGKTFTFKKKGS